MQLAVASYVCPGAAGTGTGAKSIEVTENVMAGMPCAETMAANPLNSEPDQLNLCHAHCQAGGQSADKYESPSPVHITALPANFTLVLTALVFVGLSLQTMSTLKRTTAPPLTLQNCCLRL